MIKITQKGFSLPEVMLAAFVLAVGIIAAIALIANSMKHSIDSRDEVIAAQLAQEGVELVRNWRDNSMLNGQPYDFVNLVCNGNANEIEFGNTDKDCTGIIDVLSPQLRLVSGEQYSYYNTLYYDESTGHYSHNPSGTPTKFKRYIALWYPGSADGSTRDTYTNSVTSAVFWGEEPPIATNPDHCITANKCAFAAEGLRAEKCPQDPQGRVISATSGAYSCP